MALSTHILPSIATKRRNYSFSPIVLLIRDTGISKFSFTMLIIFARLHCIYKRQYSINTTRYLRKKYAFDEDFDAYGYQHCAAEDLRFIAEFVAKLFA